MNLDPNRRMVPFVIGKIVVVQILLNWPFMNYGWNVLQHVSSIYHSMGVSCWLAALELICYCFVRFSFLQYVVGKIVVSADTIIFYDSWNTGSMQLKEPSKYNFAILEAARKYFVWKIYLLCFSRSIMTLCLQVSILITVPLRRGMMVCVSHVLGYTAGTRQEMCMGNRLGQPGGFLHFPVCCKPNYPGFGLFNFGQLYLLGARSNWNTINQCLNSCLS